MKIKLSHHHSWRPVWVCIRGPYQTIGDGCRVARSLSTAEWFWAKHQNENWVSQHLFISRVKCLWTKPTHTAMDLAVTLLCWCTVFWEMKYKFLIKTLFTQLLSAQISLPLFYVFFSDILLDICVSPKLSSLSLAKAYRRDWGGVLVSVTLCKVWGGSQEVSLRSAFVFLGDADPQLLSLTS